MNLTTKIEQVKDILSHLPNALVAFSGGVDSTLALRLAMDYVPGPVLAVTAASATYPIEEIEYARELAHTMGANWTLIHTCELDNPQFSANPPERCYHCKTELFCQLRDLAKAKGITTIIDGSNADDSGDFRPGSKAAAEFGVISPLKQAGFTKTDVRELAKALDLASWDKPSMACLSSRFPYGFTITPERLQQVGLAEQFLRKKGLANVRVRHHDTIARIEVDVDQLPQLTQGPLRQELLEYLKELGFTYVTVDLQGFKSGSMNDVLTEEKGLWT